MREAQFAEVADHAEAPGEGHDLAVAGGEIGEHVADRLAGQATEKTVREAPAPDVHTRQAEDRTKFALGTRVTIKRRGSKGVIQIEYSYEDELQRMYELLVGA